MAYRLEHIVSKHAEQPHPPTTNMLKYKLFYYCK